MKQNVDKELDKAIRTQVLYSTPFSEEFRAAMDPDKMEQSDNSPSSEYSGLLGCPFCGRAPSLNSKNQFGWEIGCLDCDFSPNALFGTRTKAIRSWNQRNGELAGMQDWSRSGPSLIPSSVMVRRVQYRRPSFGRHRLLHRFSVGRTMLAAYFRWVRRRWEKDDANWRDVPKNEVIMLKNGDYMAHPVIVAKIRAMSEPLPLGHSC